MERTRVLSPQVGKLLVIITWSLPCNKRVNSKSFLADMPVALTIKRETFLHSKQNMCMSFIRSLTFSAEPSLFLPIKWVCNYISNYCTVSWKKMAFPGLKKIQLYCELLVCDGPRFVLLPTRQVVAVLLVGGSHHRLALYQRMVGTQCNSRRFTNWMTLNSSQVNDS